MSALFAKPSLTSEEFSAVVMVVKALLSKYGMANLLAALAKTARDEADKQRTSNGEELFDVWMGLYARLRSLYESKAVPADWPRPQFTWFEVM